MTFISSHIICKENSNLGDKFLQGALTSLYNAAYPNEIIFIDNGNAPFIREKLESIWKPKFKDIDCKLKIYDSKLDDFTSLRNECLEYTNSLANYIHWQDSDEIYYEEDLDVLKNNILKDENIGQLWTYFYHFMIHPFQIQVSTNLKDVSKWTINDARVTKDNIFKYSRNLKWDKSLRVHEHMTGIDHSLKKVQTEVSYLHYGYCRLQYITTLKWIKYSLLSDGHTGAYELENIDVDEDGNNILDTGKPKVKQIQKDYFRDWRQFNNICWDRRKYCIPYPNKDLPKTELPQGAIDLIGDCKDEKDWINYLYSIDDHSFEFEWLKKIAEFGSTRTTLPWVVEGMNKINWRII